jgi:hypothetical protein
MSMKHISYLFAIVSMAAASCVAQPTAPASTPTPPARPVRAPRAAAAVPAAPRVPAGPAVPAPPEDPDQADIRHEAEKIRGEADKLKMATDQLAKIRYDSVLADPFNEADDANQTLVLSRDLSDGKTQADTEEDLKVMAHILQKASRSQEERSAGVWGIFYRSPFGSSPALRNLYLDGYGAVFFLSVNYSLTPPPTKAEDVPEPKNDRDAEWENARREISDPHAARSEGGGGGRGGQSGGGKFGLTPANPEPPFDPDRVENLQKNLAQALKNAAHIRALQKDEFVTIVVSARSPSGTRIPTRTVRRAGPETPVPAQPRPPRLTMRAKKSDIEAFQKDKLTLEEFRKKLTVSIS